MNRIIMISDSPNQLHIYDPVTQADSTVALPATPLSLSITPNGLTAAVGMANQIVTVNLGSAAIERTLAVTGSVSSLVAARDYIHFSTPSAALRSVAIASGVITVPTTDLYSAVVDPVLDASGSYLYFARDYQLIRADVSSGPVTVVDSKNTFNANYYSCFGGRTFAGGARLVTACGYVISTTAAIATDRVYEGSLPFPRESMNAAVSLDVSDNAQRIAAIAQQDAAYDVKLQKDNEVYIFDTTNYRSVGILRIPDFKPGGNAYQAHGKWIFFDADGTNIHVISQADSTSGLLRDFAIHTFSLSNPVPCAPNLTPSSSISIPWSGTIDAVSVVADSSCIYASTSSANWFQVTNFPLASGSGSVQYHVQTNFSGATRSATLSIGGQPITITQDAAPSPLPDSWRLSYSMWDSGKSTALNRIAVVPKDLRELHIFAPSAGLDTVIPLPRKAFSVSVRPDGLAAAVGMDGLIGIVDLQTATLVETYAVEGPVTNLVYAGNGYVYLTCYIGYYSKWLTYQVSTKAFTTLSDSAPARMRLHPSGGFMYTSNYNVLKWAVSNSTLSRVNTSNYVDVGNFWLSEDGARIFGSNGFVYRSSSSPAQDLALNGSLNTGAGVPTVSWVDHSAAKASIAAVAPFYGAYDRYGLFIFGDEYLGLGSFREFAKVRVGQVDYINRGWRVFWGANGDGLTAFSGLSGTPALVNNTMVTTIASNIGSNGCTVALGTSSASVAGAGETGTVAVTTGTDCNWTASSSAAWLRVSAGGFSMGPGNLSFTADRNPYGLPRQATLTIGGQTFTVTQAAGTPTAVPAILSVTPANPTAVTTAVNFTVRDLDGFANLSRIYFQIGSSTVIAANGCHGFYDRASNQVGLFNDALSGLVTPALTMGTNGVVENLQCRINGTGSSIVSASGTDLSVTLSMSLKGSYLNGSKNVYVWTTDVQNNGTGWVKTGTWTPAVPVNVAPTMASASPSTANGVSQTLSVQARDANGAEDVSRIYFLINTTTVIPQNGCHGYYERGTNQIYLYNDALSAVLGPITPGGSGAIENSQCKVDAATSAVSVSDTVNLNLTLGMQVKGAYAAGTRNMYYWVVDSAAAGTGWTLGTAWTATSQPSNQPPTVVSGSPTNSTANITTFTFVVRDPDGYANLSKVYFLINPTLSIPANTCHGFYDPSNNSFSLFGDGLTSLQGPIEAGTLGTLQNSQCSIEVGESRRLSASGTDLSFSMRMTLRGSSTSGARKVALWAVDAQGNGTGWQQTSTWLDGSVVGPTAPTLASVSPANTTAANTTFTVTARDANGFGNISRIYFLINSTPTIVTNGCHGFYDRAMNAIYVYNDGLTAVGTPVGQSQSGQSAGNSQCSIAGSGFTVSASGTDLTLTLPVSMKGSFSTGSRNLYFWVVDETNLGTGWQAGAAFTLSGSVTPAAPVVASASPSNASGNGRTFTVTAQDANGAGDISRVYFLIAPTPSITANSCHGLYDRPSNKVYLYNAALTALVPGSITPGVAGGLSNGQCSLDGAQSSVSTSGNNLTLSLNATRLGTYSLASLNVYWWVVDNAATGTGWVLGSTWAP